MVYSLDKECLESVNFNTDKITEVKGGIKKALELAKTLYFIAIKKPVVDVR